MCVCVRACVFVCEVDLYLIGNHVKSAEKLVEDN